MRPLLLWVLFSTHAWAGAREEVWGAINEERIADAQKQLAAWKSDAPERRFLEGYLAFLTGRYADGATAFEELKEGLSGSEDMRELHRLIKRTSEVLSKYEEHSSPRGHFIVRHGPGKDAILVPYALDALEKAYDSIGADFADLPSEPVRVEIVPDAETLAEVSSLTLKEIETSGTIALCKYNRLTIISPRALAYGYPWLDTLTHEYTHYIVSRVSKNHVPIWLHEGLAKFEERRWQDEKPGGSAMSPTMEHLLSGALHPTEKLISFSRMHPSIAKLPSQEQAALAFAEVFSAVEFLHQRIGWKGIRKVVEDVRESRSAEKSIAKVLNQPFSRFEAEWKAWLKKRELKRRPGQLTTALKFKKIDSAKTGAAPPDDESELTNKDAKRHARLGGMLRVRHHLQAAAAEYEKAQSFVGAGHPRLANKLGRTYLELGQYDKAIDTVRPAIERYPEDAGPSATLGEALFKKGKYDDAQKAILQSIASSPFDPTMHCMLKDIFDRGHDSRADQERSACELLGGK